MRKVFVITSIIILVVICTLLGIKYFKKEVGPEYTNPVFEPVLADPSIIKADDGYFYAYGTEDVWAAGQASKLVPIVRSNNLVDWEYIGNAFEEKPSWKSDGGIWAPDIAYYQDQYYLYYSQSVWGDPNPGIGVATAETPDGPFEDQGKLFDSEEIDVDNSIDPQFFIDDETPYVFWGSWNGIWGIELSDDGLDYVGEKFLIAGHGFEAPYVIKRNDFYYLFVSKGSCCEGENSTYHVAVGRSDSLDGPYVDKDGAELYHSTGTDILIGGDQFVGPGHNSILTDDQGDDWIFYHAIDRNDPEIIGGPTRRPLMMDKIIWEDDWPSIEGGTPSDSPTNGPVVK